MNTLIPHFEFRVLRFEYRRTAGLVRPIFMSNRIIISFDLFDIDSIVPRIGQQFSRALEIVLDVALPTNKRAHFLP